MISAVQRRKSILEHVNQLGYMQVVELAEMFGVTTATIRTDLTAMENSGLLFRVHGSAMSRNPVTRERSTYDKSLINAEEKDMIGRKAVELISDNDSIFVAAGSTVKAFCEHLPADMRLDIFTPSIQVATMLSSNAGFCIHLLGGIVHYQSLSSRGEYSESVLDTMRCSSLIIGADGITKNGDITCSTVEEALFMKKVIKCAMKVVLLCDSTKIGKTGLGKICGMDQIDILVTDPGISASDRARFESFGARVII